MFSSQMVMCRDQNILIHENSLVWTATYHQPSGPCIMLNYCWYWKLIECYSLVYAIILLSTCVLMWYWVCKNCFSDASLTRLGFGRILRHCVRYKYIVLLLLLLLFFKLQLKSSEGNDRPAVKRKVSNTELSLDETDEGTQLTDTSKLSPAFQQE